MRVTETAGIRFPIEIWTRATQRTLPLSLALKLQFVASRRSGGIWPYHPVTDEELMMMIVMKMPRYLRTYTIPMVIRRDNVGT